VVGDTVEEFDHIEQTEGPSAARRWLRGELWRVVWHAPRHRVAVWRQPLTRVVASLLYQVEPHDPLTFAAVAVVLAVVAMPACYLPARRAMRVDAVVALRAE
jgi:ABC-type lipoprotein release transport system permease subunit